MKNLKRFLCLAFLPLLLFQHGFAEGIPDDFSDVMPAKLADGLILKVEENGRTQAIPALWQNDHCYIPAEAIESLTCYIHEETGPMAGRFVRRGQYIGGHSPAFYVEYSGESRQLKYHTWYKILFYPLDGVLEHGGVRYLPLDQLLPFLHVQWERKDDRLVLTNDAHTLGDVLPCLDQLIFHMDDIVDGGFFFSRMAQVSNFAIDALLNFRVEYFLPAFDEVNGLSGSQGIHDNVETVVKGYLADDSAYLNDDGTVFTAGNGYLYDHANGTAAQTVKTLTEMKSASSDLKKYLKKLDLSSLQGELNALHLEDWLTVTKALSVCESMLTDHYRMLDAMFNFSGGHAGAVSTGYFAEITRYVWEMYSSTLTAMTGEELRAYTTNEMTRLARNAIKGAFLTNAQQVILDAAFRVANLFTNADRWSKSMVKCYYHDAFAGMAAERIDALLRQDLTKENLEDVRLCTLMLLTASRQGFEELADFYDAQKSDMQDAVQVFRDQADRIRQYQQALYLCYDTVCRDCPEACSADQPLLMTELRRMYADGQIYDFDPYAFEGIEISISPAAEGNGIRVRSYHLQGESQYQIYRISLPLFDTGDPLLDDWLWQTVSGTLYANHTLEKRLSKYDDDYEYMKDNISVSFGASLGMPGVICISKYYSNTPATMADRYYEVESSSLYDLGSLQEMQPWQLLNVDEMEYRMRISEAIYASDDFQAYLQRGREKGWETESSASSLALRAITDQGWVFSEDDPGGVAYYASQILVPWDQLPFDLPERREATAENEIPAYTAPDYAPIGEQDITPADPADALSSYGILDHPSNLHAAPNAAAESVGAGSVSSLCVILRQEQNQEGAWYLVQSGAGSGYVHSDHLRRLTMDELAAYASQQERSAAQVRTEAVSRINSALSGDEAHRYVDPDTGAIVLNAREVFETAKAEILPDALARLDHFWRVYLDVLLDPQYEGFLDQIVIQCTAANLGAQAANHQLAQARTQAVMNSMLLCATPEQNARLKHLLTTTVRSAGEEEPYTSDSTLRIWFELREE